MTDLDLIDRKIVALLMRDATMPGRIDIAVCIVRREPQALAGLGDGWRVA